MRECIQRQWSNFKTSTDSDKMQSRLQLSKTLYTKSRQTLTLPSSKISNSQLLSFLSRRSRRRRMKTIMS